jgi:hypothetical protein
VKPSLALACLLLLTTVVAQRDDNSRPNGSIYGMVVDSEGQPADRIGLTAAPQGVGLGALLPHTTTDQRGEYRFANLPWWGRYTVYADDEEAGYSDFSTGSSGQSQPPEVEITPDHREAELKVHLPPKAGFLRLNLTNRRTGSTITSMRAVVMRPTIPPSLLFSISCSSTQVLLLPPDNDLLLHVTSDGFQEWAASVGNGKWLRLTTGARLTLDVQLEPLN